MTEMKEFILTLIENEERILSEYLHELQNLPKNQLPQDWQFWFEEKIKISETKIAEYKNCLKEFEKKLATGNILK